MFTGETLEEDSFEYSGPVEECKGGGGGSTSGTVDYPAYMKTVHGEWLDNFGADTIGAGQSITHLIAAGVSNSPFSGEIAYAPDTDIAFFTNALADFETAVDGVDELTLWDVYANNVKATVDTDIIDETTIAAATTAHETILADKLTTEILPRFETGMRDMNAVMSSSFVIGKAVIEGFNSRSVADFDAKIRLQSYSQRNQLIQAGISDTMSLLSTRLSFRDSVAKASVETYRIKAVLKKEEIIEQLDIDSKDYKWGLELYQFGGNILSSISGSAVSTMRGPSTAQSVLGGAMGGAAAGYQVGGGKGAAIGAIGGGILGAMS